MSASPLLKDVLREGSNRYTDVRLDARMRCRRNNRHKQCEKCGYTKHVEICHIHSINSFNLDTPIDVINANDNLIVLCPNCHWEFDNLNKIDKFKCPLCGNYKWKDSIHCRKCNNDNKFHIRSRKVVWPTKDELLKLIETIPLIHIGKQFGVSTSSIKRWCKYYNILLSNRSGYWSKIRCKQNKLVVGAGRASRDERL